VQPGRKAAAGSVGLHCQLKFTSFNRAVAIVVIIIYTRYVTTRLAGVGNACLELDGSLSRMRFVSLTKLTISSIRVRELMINLLNDIALAEGRRVH
jgi:hypothetical protein